MLNEIFTKGHKSINITVKLSCEISTWVLKTNWIIYLHWGHQRIGLLEIFKKKDFRQNFSRDYCVLNILSKNKSWWLLLTSSLWKCFNRVTCSVWNVFPETWRRNNGPVSMPKTSHNSEIGSWEDFAVLAVAHTPSVCGDRMSLGRQLI